MDIEAVLSLALVAVFLWGIPLGLIIGDPIVSRKERHLRMFATVFVSWLAWLLFLWVAPVIPRRNPFMNRDAQ